MRWRWHRLVGPVVRWWRAWRTPLHQRWAWRADICPWCGADLGAAYLDPAYFTCEQVLEEGPTGQLMEGIQTCPRCRYRWPIQAAR